MARGIGARRSNELYGGLLGDYLSQAGGLLADRAGEVISGQALEEYIQSLFPGFGTYEIVDGKLTFPEARAPEGGVTGLFGEFMSGGGVAGTIAGVGAKTADRGLLAIAEEAEQRGLPQERIFDATGWFRGADGKWRFEIDDSQATLRDSGPRGWEQEYFRYAGEDLNHPALYEAYPQIGSTKFQRGPDDQLGYGGAAFLSEPDAVLFGQMPNDLYAKEVMGHELQHKIQFDEGFSRGGNPRSANVFAASRFLEQRDPYILGHQKYDDAVEAIKPYWIADHINDFNKILSKQDPKPRDIFRWADWYEYGDDIRRQFGPMPKKRGQERTTWIRDAAKYMRDAYIAEKGPQGVSASKMLEDIGERGVKNAMRRIDRKLAKYRDDAWNYKTNTREAKNVLEENPETVYRKLAGEVEARNTQNRLSFSPDYRRMYPPFLSQEFPNNLQYFSADAIHPDIYGLLQP